MESVVDTYEEFETKNQAYVRYQSLARQARPQLAMIDLEFNSLNEAEAPAGMR